MASDRDDPLTMGLRERKKARQREAILNAAIALFREHGYDATTVEDIARACEISQPTFYNYFGSKDSLLREFATVGAFHALEKLRTETGSVEKRLRSYFNTLARSITTDRALWQAMAVSNAYNPVRDPSVLRSEHAGTRGLERLFAEGQKSGELGEEFSAAKLASLIEGMMLRACIEWNADFPKSHSLRESFSKNLDFFFRAARG